MGEVQEGKGVEEEDGDGGRRLECHRRVENEDAENNSQHMDEQIENAIGREEGLHDVDAETEGRGDGDEELINVGVGEAAERTTSGRTKLVVRDEERLQSVHLMDVESVLDEEGEIRLKEQEEHASDDEEEIQPSQEGGLLRRHVRGDVGEEEEDGGEDGN